MKFRICTTSSLLAVALLSACASSLSTESSPSAAACCQRMEEFVFTPLSRSEREFQINARSSSFAFDQGRSRFVALEIQDADKPQVLELKTFLSSASLPKATVFAPRLLVLDGQRRLIREVVNPTMTPGVEFIDGGFWSISVPLQAGERYVVVYTEATKLRQVILRANSQAYNLVPGTSAAVISNTYWIPRVDEGMLKVKLQ